MKITILGAGAVGSVVGAALCGENDVTLVSRPEHAEAIRRDGLRILGDADRLVRLAAAEAVPASGPGDLLLVTLKAHALHQSLAEAADRIPEGTLVGLLLNGLGVEDVAGSVLPGRRIVRVIVGIGATLRSPGEVEHWAGPTLENWGGPGLDFPATDWGREAMAAFSGSWMRTRLRDDFTTVLWRKLAVNCTVNPLTALLGVRNCDIVAPETAAIRRAVFEEVRAVAALHDIAIESSFSERIDERIRATRNWSSMYQDVERGRPTEIDFLNGAIVERGRACGVPTPVNETLAALIRSLSPIRQARSHLGQRRGIRH